MTREQLAELIAQFEKENGAIEQVEDRRVKDVPTFWSTRRPAPDPEYYQPVKDYVASNPGQTARQVAEALGIDRQLVYWAARRFSLDIAPATPPDQSRSRCIALIKKNPDLGVSEIARLAGVVPSTVCEAARTIGHEFKKKRKKETGTKADHMRELYKRGRTPKQVHEITGYGFRYCKSVYRESGYRNTGNARKTV